MPASQDTLKLSEGHISLILYLNGPLQNIADFKTQKHGGPCPTKGRKSHETILSLFSPKTKKLGLEGWSVFLSALKSLKSEDLEKIIYIRNKGHTVLESINRQK